MIAFVSSVCVYVCECSLCVLNEIKWLLKSDNTTPREPNPRSLSLEILHDIVNNFSVGQSARS